MKTFVAAVGGKGPTDAEIAALTTKIDGLAHAIHDGLKSADIQKAIEASGLPTVVAALASQLAQAQKDLGLTVHAKKPLGLNRSDQLRPLTIPKDTGFKVPSASTIRW